MHYDGDAFISYAHLDNQELVEGHKGWVANLHRALEIRVGQLIGKQPTIWRDPKLTGNDFFADTLVERLRRVAVLVSIVSPRYVKSEWARRELTEFWRAAEQQGGVKVHDRARVFKVLKTPVPLEMTPAELRSMLGYEFFRVDHESGKIRELDGIFGAEAQREFWMKLDDLAHDIGDLLRQIEGADLDDQPADRGTVYLAETTSDLREEWLAIRRDLQQHGYTVVPGESLPLVAGSLEAEVRAQLARSQLSVHFVGRHYGLVPEDGTASVVEIQNALALERAAQGPFSRLVWMPAGLRVDDPRQRSVVERIRLESHHGGDLLETYFEDLRTAVHEWLARDATPASAPRDPAPAATVPRLYFLYDQRDADVVAPWAQWLFDQRLEVVHPLFDGDETDLREEHDENLRACDGIVIAFGTTGEGWLRRKLREIQKSAGYGRTKPPAPLAIVVLGPTTAEKERFRSHEAVVVPQLNGCEPDPLLPFVARVRGQGPQS